jgi:hypothetical protein
MYAARILRRTPDDRLGTMTPADFQRWPAERPLPTKIGRELIDAERAARAAGQRSAGAVK